MSWPVLIMTFGSLFALGCDDTSSSGPTAALNAPAVLAPGETARFGALRVTFKEVTGDSRCPVDVTCVWEGDAVARIELSEPAGAVETHELHTAKSQQPQPVVYGGYQVDLVRLDPEPRSTGTIPPSSYRLAVRVTQKS
jgi:hypothetical protein